jgi:hypothetical protein
MFSLEQPEYQTWGFHWGFNFNLAGKKRVLPLLETVESEMP